MKMIKHKFYFNCLLKIALFLHNLCLKPRIDESQNSSHVNKDKKNMIKTFR